MTFGYSPVMIEHLFDEALVWALRDGRDAMNWADVQQAKITEEIGLEAAGRVHRGREAHASPPTKPATPSSPTSSAQDRKLEVLSIIKRRDALGLLAHSDTEERFTRTAVGADRARSRSPSAA